MSVEATVSVMSEQDAERLTTRITLMAGTIREGVEKLHDLVQQAKDGNAHVALGYPSWTAYLADVLGKQPIRLAPAERRELVGYLAGEGMSTRAIAPIVGASKSQVANDLSPVQKWTPAEAVDTDTGEITETAGGAPVVSAPVNDGSTPSAPPALVTGLDGKTYTKPAKPAVTKAPPRRPLTDQFVDAAYDLNKAVERLLRLTADDRFPSNAEKVAGRCRGDLLRANDSLAGVISAITNQSGV